MYAASHTLLAHKSAWDFVMIYFLYQGLSAYWIYNIEYNIKKERWMIIPENIEFIILSVQLLYFNCYSEVNIELWMEFDVIGKLVSCG